MLIRSATVKEKYIHGIGILKSDFHISDFLRDQIVAGGSDLIKKGRHCQWKRVTAGWKRNCNSYEAKKGYWHQIQHKIYKYATLSFKSLALDNLKLHTLEPIHLMHFLLFSWTFHPHTSQGNKTSNLFCQDFEQSFLSIWVCFRR